LIPCKYKSRCFLKQFDLILFITIFSNNYIKTKINAHKIKQEPNANVFVWDHDKKKKKQMKTNDEAQFKINKILKGKIENKKKT
jgi:hypothetical protein